MDFREYEKMFEAEDRYFWFVAKHRLIADILRRELRAIVRPKILDVGCGTGGMIKFIADWSFAAGIDPNRDAIDFFRKRKIGNPIRGNIDNIPFAGGSFDAIIASDVLEHLDEDIVAARQLFRVLAPGAIAVITVPGIRWLWSSHDVALGHKRRYSKQTLEILLKKAGFERVEVFSYMSATAPLVVALRSVGNLIGYGKKNRTIDYKLPNLLNSSLLAILDIERKIVLRGIDLSVGATLVASARKPMTG